MKRFLVFSVVFATIVGSSGTYAEETAEETNDSQFTFEEIVVTVRRVSENLQEVPITVNVVDGEDFLEKGLYEFADIAHITPGLQIAGQSGAENFVSIRGVGNLGTASPLSPSVTVFIDDAPAMDSSFLISSTLDIGRVEVLRGPQGTLYGTNATAGAINVYSRDPSLDGITSGHIEGSYSRYPDVDNDILDLEAAVDLTLIEGRLGVRIAGSRRRDDGFINNPFIDDAVNSFNQDNVRAKLLWTPYDEVEARLTIGYVKAENQEVFTINVPAELGRTGPPASFANLDLFDYKTSQTPDINPEDRFYTVLGVDWDTSWGTLTSITSYQEQSVNLLRDGDNLGVFDDIVAFDFVRESLTQEIRLAGEAFENKFNYVVGIFYNKGEGEFTSFVDFTGSGSLSVPYVDLGGPSEGQSSAAFSNATVHLSDRISISLGGRVERSEREINDPFINLSASELSIALGGDFVRGVLIDSSSESNWAASAKLVFKVNSHLMIYGAADRAFRRGGYNANATPAFIGAGLQEFDTENTQAFEIGLKSDGWFDGRLLLNAAAYFQTYDDYQYQTFSPVQYADITPSLQGVLESTFGLPPRTLTFLGYPASDGVFFELPTTGLVVNAPEAENLGVELEFLAQVTENWSVGGSISTNEFEFTDFDNVPTSAAAADPELMADPVLSTFGLGTAYAGRNAQALLNSVGALSGFPPGTLLSFGDVIGADTIPRQDLTGLGLFGESERSVSYTLTSEYRRAIDFLLPSVWFVRGIYAFNEVSSNNRPTIRKDTRFLNVFLGLADVNGRWTAQLYSTNTLNEKVPAAVLIDIDSALGPSGLPSAPREIGFTFRYNF